VIYLAISAALVGFLAWRALDKSKNRRGQFWLSVGMLLSGCLIFGIAIFYERQSDGMEGIYYAVVASLTFWFFLLPSVVSLIALYIRKKRIEKEESLIR
jgi:uncharacterized membrane protein YhaH (DUF805 family)